MKYNIGGVNNLVSMAMDDTENKGGENGRDSTRKQLQNDKDITLSIVDLSEKSPFKARSLSFKHRMCIAELSQLENQTWREYIQSTIINLSNKRNDLLIEQGQLMKLAKYICPTFDN